MDDTLAYNLKDCERRGGVNPVSAQGVGGSVPLVTADLEEKKSKPKSVKCSPHLELAVQPCELGDIS